MGKITQWVVYRDQDNKIEIDDAVFGDFTIDELEFLGCYIIGYPVFGNKKEALTFAKINWID